MVSFAVLPMAHAEEEEAEVLNPDKTGQVFELIKEDKIWSKFNNFRQFDINKPIEGVGDNFAISDESTATETGDLFWVWEKDGNDNYNFKLFVKGSDPSLDEYITNNEYKGEVINVKFKSLYDLNNGSNWRHSFTINHAGRGNTTLGHSGENNATFPMPEGTDIWLKGNGEGQQRNDNILGATTFQPEKWVPSDDGQLRIIQSREYKFDDEYIENRSKGKVAEKDLVPMYSEAGSSSNKGIAGAAIFITNVDENGKELPGAPEGTGTDAFPGTTFNIEADFIGNGLKGSDTDANTKFGVPGILPEAKRVSNPHGGAIYTSLGVHIGSIKGDFIGNYIETNSKGYGGAIYNMGRIDEMESNFLFNYVKSTDQGAYSANAGAICNGKESSDPDPVGGYIGSLKGYFIGNYVSNEAAGKDTLGGAIINYGTIGSLDGVFIGNYNSSTQTANSGVIRNYAQNHWMATIGPEKDVDANKTVFNGIFIGNYSRGVNGDAFAGVMRNNGNINGRIEGVYVGNYAMTDGTLVTGDTNPDGQNGGQVGAYNYLKWSKDNNQYVIGNSGMAYGGVFYNDIKLEDNQASGKPYIGNIKATFVENYAFSKYGEAFGGAIFNQDAEIQNIHGHFQGNYSKSEYFIARAGALYNDTNEAGKGRGFIGTIRQIGLFNKDGSVEELAFFNENYAQGKMAQGGAIYVSNDSTIEEVAAVFTGNTVVSKVSTGDSEYYYELKDSVDKALFDPTKLVESGMLTPTAQGGALYVADGGSTHDIYGSFEDNSAVTNGVGLVTKQKQVLDADGAPIWHDAEGNLLSVNDEGQPVDQDGNVVDDAVAQTVEVSMNESETAQGGAIYVARLHDAASYNIKDVAADFVNNYVENKGETELQEVSAIAQGGAVYVYDSGKVKDILGSFKSNSALGHSKGSTLERVQGGAIYVSGGATIDDIGMDGSEVKFSLNRVEATGMGYTAQSDAGEEPVTIGRLETQTAEGGAIYVSSTTVAAEDGTESVHPGSIGDIYADFAENKVLVETDASSAALAKRTARGGAIYISHEGKIGKIAGSGDEGSGFNENSITVSGGAADAAAELTAQGGAIYVADSAKVNAIVANFTGNKIDTSDSTGNELERAGGGAIYVDGNAVIGATLEDGIGSKDEKVEITGNRITVGGKGENLSRQYARGGAIFVGTAGIGDAADLEKAGRINSIYATISGNEIEAHAEDDTQLSERIMRGGAIFLSDGGRIEFLYAGEGKRGLERNSITVTGGSANGSATLRAGGGAMFVSESGGAKGIMAGFAGNFINTVKAKGNESEYVRGGAIFLDQNGTIQSIGESGNEVEVRDNYLMVSGNGANLKEQLVQGGAMYVSGTNKGDSTELPTVVTITDIHADILNNRIIAQKGDSQNLTTRQLEGGAIYLANRGYIGEIHQGSVGFVGNSVTLSEEVIADTEKVYGGAIYVADFGRIDEIDAHFVDNSVSNSKHEAAAEMKDGELKSAKHAKGGAIYLAENGRIGKIGTEKTMYTRNQAIGTGEVRAGAVFVSKAEVDQIFGTFLRNSAINTAGKEDGTEAEKLLAAEGRLLTYGGAMRFDQSTIFSLDADFVQNYTNGTGGGLSLTNKGIIYEVHGDFLGNISKVNGGAVDAMGNIGLRGYAVTSDDLPLRSDFKNAQFDPNDESELWLQRDSTDTLRYDPSGEDADARRYKNKQGRGEYDGSFTGGFINSNFLYNRVNGDDGVLDNTDGHYFRGAGIYTDKDLFITVEGEEVIMSGNAIVNADKTMTRSAIYVDNMRYNPSEEDYQSIVVYLVAQKDGILRIDDNIRGHADTEHGLLLRLRGYADRHFNKNYRDDSGFIILNNRVEQTYTVMDDVTLYIGYKPRTFNDESYFANYGDNGAGGSITFDDVLVGDEGLKNIIMKDAQGKDRVSFYLDIAGNASRDGKEILRSDKGADTLEHHQSDIFRDSHMSVRSGTVALTESHYAIRTGNKGGFTDMLGEEAKEVYTEYLFGSLIAYGADYNYGEYGTMDVDDSVYTEQGLDRTSVRTEYVGSSMEVDTQHSTKYFQFRRGSDEGLYASFEFGVSYEPEDVYTLAPKGKYYYLDMNGNYTEKSSWTDANGEVHDYTLTDVPVERQMAKSDVLTVFAVWKDGKVDWKQASKGRVTLNGFSVKNAVRGWEYVRKTVNGEQTDANFGEDGMGKDSVLDTKNYNHDIYVQLINYVLVEETTDAAGNVVRTPVEDAAALEEFYRLFEEPKEDAADDTNSGYHLLRLSDHFDLVSDAKAYMKGSDVLADEIELATTVTKDDTLHIVGWRDHLAEWAEHEGSVTNEAIAAATADPKAELQETLNLYTGRKHFLLDQSVYYLNRNINLEPNPTDEHHDPTGPQMWGQFLTIEGKEKWRTLDLQGFNMLSRIINDQEVRLQSFSLTHVQKDHMDNYGHLIFDTMHILDGIDFSAEPKGGLVVNNAGTGTGTVNENRMTVTGLTDINFTITTEAELKDKPNTLRDDTPLDYKETKEHGTLVFDHSTQVTDKASQLAADADGAADLLKASVVHINGVVEHQNIFHYGEDDLKLATENKTYQEPGEEAQTLPTYSIEKGHVGAGGVRESFSTNTYLNTTDPNLRNEAGYRYVMTDEFRAFRDNSLTMNGGAFNLGDMYKHRLVLRDFAVNGGGVFVGESIINLKDEVMGGIDTTHSATYKGDAELATAAQSTSGTGDGLIWLDHFYIEDTSDKLIVHVKFVDDGVGNAVKDGMGIADGANSKGKMRIMQDGKGVYNWEVTYNDEEAENAKEDPGWVGIRGMYTFRRRSLTEEAKISPVTQVMGSYMTMMQVYNYGFQHADMFADSVYAAQRERLSERSFTVVNATKGKNAVAAAPRPCVDKASLRSGLWFNTFASAEETPLHNGPKVRMDMYGGFLGADSNLNEHRNGWASVWSFYGGYVGSTQRYEGVRIRQNGAAVGGTGTFYKKNFYTAFTASIGAADARATGRGGSEDFTLLMGGVASRSGFNFTLGDGRYVIQPNLLLSFSLFDAADYTNAYGSQISNKPGSVFQVNPSVKFIRKTDCVWKPYASVGFVYNLFSNGGSSINGTELPSMGIDPYVEYSLGVQRSLGEDYTIFGQATGRNGGRNGVEVSAGLRWTW